MDVAIRDLMDPDRLAGGSEAGVDSSRVNEA